MELSNNTTKSSTKRVKASLKQKAKTKQVKADEITSDQADEDLELLMKNSLNNNT